MFPFVSSTRKLEQIRIQNYLKKNGSGSNKKVSDWNCLNLYNCNNVRVLYINTKRPV
jgi:hypothetical protein